MSTAPTPTPDALAGRTWHVLRGARYTGTFAVATAGAPDPDGWQHVRTANGVEWYVRAADCFATEAEAEARAEARARRRPPRRPRTPQPLHGDYAALAMFYGIATDGTGRRVPR